MRISDRRYQILHDDNGIKQKHMALSFFIWGMTIIFEWPICLNNNEIDKNVLNQWCIEYVNDHGLYMENLKKRNGITESIEKDGERW